MKRMRNLKGFTLIELIVVILILGILAAIAVVGYSNITQKANETALVANATQIAKSLSVDATLNEASSVNAFLLDTDNNATTAETAVTAQAYLDGKFLPIVTTYTATTVTVKGSGTATKVIDITGQIASVNP